MIHCTDFNATKNRFKSRTMLDTFKEFHLSISHEVIPRVFRYPIDRQSLHSFFFFDWLLPFTSIFPKSVILQWILLDIVCSIL